MDFFTAMDISASGLKAQRTRINVISSNIANAETTRTADGGPYKRQDVVFESKPFEDVLSGVEVSEIVTDKEEGRKVYNPGHPDADASGMVTMPNVNTMEEMVNLIGATRGFEANTAAIKAQKDMAQRALNIGTK